MAVPKSKLKVASLIRGRFRKPVHPQAVAFSASHLIDRALYPYDLAGSAAHAKMLQRIKILTRRELSSILQGLSRIGKEIENGTFRFQDALEDIHMHIESRLTQLTGDAGAKLHTGRSRNDQVALDFRMYCRDANAIIRINLQELLGTLLDQARRHENVLMPGYTHLQQAQVVRAAHHFLAYLNMFARDLERLNEMEARIDVMPLGSGALAGTGLKNDRAFLARELGFKRISENSLDAVSDRDFALELLFAISMIALHLSRFCEELILWMTTEFDLISMDTAFCTGSSLMPQKVNPDMAELIRGKSGRFLAQLVSLFTTMKGLPLAYNRDMQEDKKPVFEAVTEILACLDVFQPMLASVRVKPDLMQRQKNDYMLATDVAEYLVGLGLPFRKAHEITGQVVQFAQKNGTWLGALTLDEWRQFYPGVRPSIRAVLKLDTSPDHKTTSGGTALREIRRQIRYWQKRLAQH